MAKKCARTFSIVVEKGKKSILDVRHLLPDALPRSVRTRARGAAASDISGVICVVRSGLTGRDRPVPLAGRSGSTNGGVARGIAVSGRSR